MGIVDYMNSVWMNSSYANRADLAKKYWINNYTGTAAQNNQLLLHLKNMNSNPNNVNNVQGGTETTVSMSRNGNDYDYKADITKDAARNEQMNKNADQLKVNSADLYAGAKENYDKKLNYDQRDQSQKDALDEAYETSNKYWLNSNENYVADNAAKINDDKNAKALLEHQKTVDEKSKNLKAYVDEVMPEYKWLIKDYEDMLGDYMDELAELRAMQKQYYNSVKKEYMNDAAGDMASIASTLSAQWLSAGAVAWAQQQMWNNWLKRYNNLWDQHLTKLQSLLDAGQKVKETVLSSKKWLYDQKAKILDDYTKAINGFADELDAIVQSGIEWHYDAYQKISDKKIEWVADTAGAWAKKDELAAQFKTALPGSEKAMLIMKDYFKGFFWDDANIADYYKYFRAASSKTNDLSKAMELVKAAYDAEHPAKSSWWIKNPDTPNPDTPNPDLWDPTLPETMKKYKTYQDYQKAFGDKAVDMKTWANGLIN